MQNKPLTISLCLLLLALVSGCKTNSQQEGSYNAQATATGTTADAGAGDDLDWLYSSDEAEESLAVNDPFENVNRIVFGFNDIIYTKLVAPPAKAYDAVMPEPAQTGISNFFTNAKFPLRWVSSMAQGKWERADAEARKFALNTTLGIGGVFKPSDKNEDLQNIPKEDLGQVLGHYGIGAGPYLVAPLFGPSNFRDFGGGFAARFLDPFTYLHDWEYRFITGAIDFTNESPNLIKRYENIVEASVDPYTAMRDGYSKLREGAIQE